MARRFRFKVSYVDTKVAAAMIRLHSELLQIFFDPKLTLV
jgi:hypothetical protein